MPQIFADITSKGITVYTPEKNGAWKTALTPLPSDFFRQQVAVDLPKFKSSSVVLVANLRKTAIRIVDIPISKRKYDKWELVSSTFPIGEQMNENTHIFDGSEFITKGNEVSRFFMAAIPIEISEAITRIGESLVGNLYRLERIDTVENILLKRYSPESHNGIVLILLPQDEGLRMLTLANGLPESAYYISNHVTHRKAEFLRGLHSIGKKPSIKVVFLYHTLEHIVKWGWIHDILENVQIEEKPFCLI
ncbi:MAG: hypothetical protein FWE05_00490 [Defluviitaleaceae bacterium]|nr:hypothetical protein [Defluviitaleaceae bacterium]